MAEKISDQTNVFTNLATATKVPAAQGATKGVVQLGTAARSAIGDFATPAQGTKADSALQPADRPKTYVGTVDPGAANDNTQGYAIGSTGYNSTGNTFWVADSVATGAAVWSRIPLRSEISTAGLSGAYADLSGKPSISTAGLSGAYADLTGKPDLTDYMLAFDAGGSVGAARPTGTNIDANTPIRWMNTGGARPTNLGINDVWDGAPEGTVSVRAVTGASNALALDDAGNIVTVSHTSPTALTIPLFASVAFLDNTTIDVFNIGEGDLSITGETGVTVNGVSGGSVTFAPRYGWTTLLKVGTNSWVVKVPDAVDSGPSGNIVTLDVQEFTSPGSGTWTKPAGAVEVQFILIGGGGGGGSGRRRADTTTGASGGPGGGGGGMLDLTVPASLLSATESYTVGAGGTGGAAQTTTANGNPGTNGGDSVFGPYRARGGRAPTNGGGNSTNGGGTGGGRQAYTASGSTVYSGNGGDGWATQVGDPGGRGGRGPGGGGGAGGFATGTSNKFAGGAGGKGASTLDTSTASTGGGGTAGVDGSGGSHAGNGAAATIAGWGGDGGGGGAGSISGQVGWDGGNGGYPGGGGGGGGGSQAANSGKGGDGADGYIRIVTRCVN